MVALTIVTLSIRQLETISTSVGSRSRGAGYRDEHRFVLVLSLKRDVSISDGLVERQVADVLSVGWL
jgi:hypothetical protein